jgi:uncharacterized protein (DUF2267 family)
MDAETFLDRAQQRLGTPHRDDAVVAVRATLLTFGEQLSGGQAEDLAAELDDEIGGYLTENAEGQPDDLDLEDFFEKVAARQSIEVGVEQAREQAIAVLDVLGDAVSEQELANAGAQLSTDYKELLTPAGGR